MNPTVADNRAYKRTKRNIRKYLSELQMRLNSGERIKTTELCTIANLSHEFTPWREFDQVRDKALTNEFCAYFEKDVYLAFIRKRSAERKALSCEKEREKRAAVAQRPQQLVLSAVQVDAKTEFRAQAAVMLLAAAYQREDIINEQAAVSEAISLADELARQLELYNQ